MTQQTTLSRVRFSTGGLSGPAGWEAWREVLTPLFDIEGNGELEAFQAELDGFDLGTLFVARIAFGGVQQTGVRSKALINRSGLDHYAVELCLESNGYVCEGRNGAAVVEAGDIVVLDLSQANVMTAANSSSLTVTVPRAILDRRCSGIESLHGARLAGPGRSGILGDHMLSLYRHLPHMTAAEANAAAAATIALLGACLAPSLQQFEQASDIIDRTLLDRAKRYIEGRIDDPHLTPAAICAAVGASRSNIYRLFEPSGGVARYVQERRLRRAHAALRDPAGWRRISELAYTCGFTSAAHFSRAFRNLFGCSPSAVRELARAPAAMPATTDTFAEDWLNRTCSREDFSR